MSRKEGARIRIILEGLQCLHGYIDDASGKIWARFEESEGVKPVLDSLQRYCNTEGIPVGLYVDKCSTYKTNRDATVDEELNNHLETEYLYNAREKLDHFVSAVKI